MQMWLFDSWPGTFKVKHILKLYVVEKVYNRQKATNVVIFKALEEVAKAGKDL